VSVETHEFQAEARQLLQLVIHSIYSNKDIFLRELISNASDALDKLRLASFQDKDLDVDTSDLRIDLEVDPEARRLTVRDNGIGMSHDEVVDLIGTIARSGTAELLRSLKEAKDPAASKELIGQFGVGFYSSFMVADEVSLVTRRAGAAEGVRWSSDGQGTYTIEPAPDAPQGTAVTLHLKQPDEEDQLFDYTAEWKLREIVKHYSDFIPWPITMGGETINSRKALWARPRDEVTDEEYHEFYKHLTHDWTDPLRTVHMRAEGTFEYEALLFIPARAPFDLFQQQGKRGIQLYVKRVFIMDDCEALVPGYLRFVKGVVDAHDLSLNVSREILQQDRQIQIIRKRLVRRLLSTFKEMRAEDASRYREFWTQFGRAVKEGLLTDADNRESILDIALFPSTHDPAEPTSLRDYLERMPEGQEHIYFMTGETRSRIEGSPHLEAFRAKGYEVLLLTEPVDELWVDVVPEFEGRSLQSIAKGELDLDPGTEKEQHEDFTSLLAWMGTALAERVKQVRLSTRLTTSAACVVADRDDLSPALARMVRELGQAVPETKGILELNPGHPLVTGLRDAHAANPDDPGLVEAAELLYGSALLAEGGELPDPARFAKLLTDRLARTL
jgi:molecular chaperone HtpG